MEFVYRPAAAQDATAIASLVTQITDLHATALPRVFVTHSPDEVMQQVASIAGEEETAVIVAEHDGQVVGAVYVSLSSSQPEPFFVPRRFALVKGLIVSESFQHQGVGGKLMQLAEEWAAEQGVDAVELNVYAFNTNAIAFYDSLRYEPFTMVLTKRLK